MNETKKIMECSICSGEIKPLLDQNGNVVWDKGNNAKPVNNGKCCDTCNTTVVVPTRMFMMREQ